MSAPLVYIDTNAFIKGFEFSAEQAKPVQDLLAALRDSPRFAVTSELTLAELRAPALREDAFPLPVRRPLYLNLLVSSQLIDLRPVTRDVLMDTADLRQAAPHRLLDAIHIVTAVQTGCAYFLTGDRRIRTPAGMSIVYPDQEGVDRILADWSGGA
ncbi:type II toxin-antitoxin system VapC family toxin [Methylocystis sp.]|uniref:type II toxin-antitoxin system VapC family toxin n=1 Tax=Methylocystis sp. TaxID=1911079 RepID=UPI003D0DAD06